MATVSYFLNGHGFIFLQRCEHIWWPRFHGAAEMSLSTTNRRAINFTMCMQEILRQFEGHFEGGTTIIMLTPHYLRGKQCQLKIIETHCNGIEVSSFKNAFYADDDIKITRGPQVFPACAWQWRWRWWWWGRRQRPMSSVPLCSWSCRKHFMTSIFVVFYVSK